MIATSGSKHGVADVERSTVTIGPLTRVVAMEDFNSWLQVADFGHEATYATGPALPKDNKVCRKAYDLAQSGHLQLMQRRGNRSKDYVARRTAKPLKQSPDPIDSEDALPGADCGRREQALAGSDAERVLNILKRCANFDRQVPSLADLAQLAGLKNRQRARYLKTVLVDQGLIEILRKQGTVQVVRIVSTGKQTRGGV